MTGVRDYSTGELKQGLGRFGQRDVCEVVAPSQRPVCSDKDLFNSNSPPACGTASYLNGMRLDQNSAGR
jgi:hypothetical protein